MPELPEVEVTRLGISPFLIKQKIKQVLIHHQQLRWPVPIEIKQCETYTILDITRRAKYLFVHTEPGTLIFHLGMSGKMRVVDSHIERKKHDHIEIVLGSGKKLVLNDPRRFGACLWQSSEDDEPMSILSKLGPEPLSEAFDVDYLYAQSKNRKSPVKSFIMDNSVVVGVGNIYASESLFKAGIDPRRAANRISKKRYLVLVEHIKEVLKTAILNGGTTLRDFAQADGNPGYFAQYLHVYGRAGEQCDKCKVVIKSKVIAQRNSFFCPQCQR